MLKPKKWTIGELIHDAEEAKRIFRKERTKDPLEQYSKYFKTFEHVFKELLAQYPSINVRGENLVEMIGNEELRAAFRYLTAPPISEDDLETLAETTISRKTLKEDLAKAQRVCDVILDIIDPHRFPWVREGRDPTEHERSQAIVASAALVAARKVETSRRSEAKKQQEDAVKGTLCDIGFVEVPRRDIQLLDDAPAVGEFCGESMLGSSRADLVIRLYDRRVMAVECKVSNSAVNSVKRINREAAGKARAWLSAFGERQIVAAAVISGVFNPSNLDEAQSQGLFLFWNHRLQDLVEFIDSTKE